MRSGSTSGSNKGQSTKKQPSYKAKRARRRLWEQLEERVLFDAVVDDLSQNEIAADSATLDSLTNVQSLDDEFLRTDAAASGKAATSASEIVFIDTGVEDLDQLLGDLKQQTSEIELVFLDPTKDGLTQIANHLDGRSEIDAIHLLSHSDQGNIALGSANVTTAQLSAHYADTLQRIGNSLSADADILIYGCDLAGNQDGIDFVNTFSRLTSADVAASDDLTGSADLGGDWDLEFTTGVITADALAALSYNSVLALSDATLSIVSDGTPVWDVDNNPGNDTDGTNGIIRSHDSIVMEVFYNTDSAGATDLHFTSTLPDGLVWDVLPAAAALDSRSMIVDSVTGLEGGDSRTIIAYLPDVAGTFTSSVNFEARALGGEQGTPLDNVQFEVHSNENPTSLVTVDYDFVLSSGAHMDLQLLAPTFRGVHTNAAGTVDGVVYSYGIGILGDHPTRTGSDGVKGAAPIEDNFTFDVDLSAVTPGATIFDWGASLGTAAEYATDGINRNYERFTTVAGGTGTAWSSSARPVGQTDEHPSAVWSEERSTPDSGDWTITGSAGSVHSVQVSGSDTTGSHFPDRRASGGVIPAGDKWFTSSMVHVWIPIDEILPGEDGISGTPDDGVLDITPVLTSFDPSDPWVQRTTSAAAPKTHPTMTTHTLS